MKKIYWLRKTVDCEFDECNLAGSSEYFRQELKWIEIQNQNYQQMLAIWRMRKQTEGKTQHWNKKMLWKKKKIIVQDFNERSPYVWEKTSLMIAEDKY